MLILFFFRCQKMKRIENDCCGCAVTAYPCRGNNCPLKNADHYYCDCCKNEVNKEDLYEYEGQELCNDCLLVQVPKAY